MSITGDNFSIGRQLALEAEPPETEPLQGRFEPTQDKENYTGMPDTLKAGIETLSSLSMDDVNVHYNSSKPAQVQALAYTQGTDIHVGPGQEKHLPHEAWHVVQQKQGRVQPTLQAKGVAINDDAGLEREADAMGKKARNIGMRSRDGETGGHSDTHRETTATNANEVGQRKCKCLEEKVEFSEKTVVQRTCYNPVPQGPYSALPEDISKVDNKDFTDKQADAILEANFQAYSKGKKSWFKFSDTPLYGSDESDQPLLHGSVTRPAEATVDHIIPYEKEGCNSVKNAQILSSTENSIKGQTFPWGKYKKYTKYVP
jgi:hypothetical protein